MAWVYGSEDETIARRTSLVDFPLMCREHNEHVDGLSSLRLLGYRHVAGLGLVISVEVVEGDGPTRRQSDQ